MADRVLARRVNQQGQFSPRRRLFGNKSGSGRAERKPATGPVDKPSSRACLNGSISASRAHLYLSVAIGMTELFAQYVGVMRESLKERPFWRNFDCRAKPRETSGRAANPGYIRVAYRFEPKLKLADFRLCAPTFSCPANSDDLLKGVCAINAQSRQGDCLEYGGFAKTVLTNQHSPHAQVGGSIPGEREPLRPVTISNF